MLYIQHVKIIVITFPEKLASEREFLLWCNMNLSWHFRVLTCPHIFSLQDYNSFLKVLCIYPFIYIITITSVERVLLL